MMSPIAGGNMDGILSTLSIHQYLIRSRVQKFKAFFLGPYHLLSGSDFMPFVDPIWFMYNTSKQCTARTRWQQQRKQNTRSMNNITHTHTDKKPPLLRWVVLNFHWGLIPKTWWPIKPRKKGQSKWNLIDTSLNSNINSEGRDSDGGGGTGFILCFGFFDFPSSFSLFRTPSFPSRLPCWWGCLLTAFPHQARLKYTTLSKFPP